MKFKIGDKVRQTQDCSGTKAGQIYTVFANWYDGTLSINEKGTLEGEHPGTSGWSACSEQYKWELVEDKPQLKFTVGDRVISKQNGEMDIIKSFPGMKEYDEYHFGKADEGFVLKNNSWEYQKNWDLVREPQREEVKEEETADNHEEHIEIHDFYAQDYQPKKHL